MILGQGLKFCTWVSSLTSVESSFFPLNSYLSLCLGLDVVWVLLPKHSGEKVMELRLHPSSSDSPVFIALQKANFWL